MQVRNEINWDTYQKLIEYASKKCNAVMFITRQDSFRNNARTLDALAEMERSMQERFKNSFLKKRTDAQWVHTKVGVSEPYDDGRFGVYFYKFDAKMKSYLLTNPDLFKWMNPEYPEDLSFFKDGRCWLYSVAHEKLCHIYCENKEEYEYLKSIGIKFYEKRFTPASEHDLYFEDYT